MAGKASQIRRFLSMVTAIVLLAGCAGRRELELNDRTEQGQNQNQISQISEKKANKPQLPKALGAKPGQEPRLRVYIHEEGQIKEMAFEDYVAGVVGGEIKNDWPEEAIKAQAIIARTFVLQFISEKGESKYKGAHVSTDIEEAQAWGQDQVNDRIKKAVKETRGQVITYGGEFARTWFHSNAGGKTATAKEGLNYKDANPPYIVSVESPDTMPEVPADEREWNASFSKEEVIAALNKIGFPLNDFSKVTIGEKGPSGRAINIMFDGKAVSAPELRIALDSTKMKSTLLDSVTMEGNQLVFKGRGYGHGVGMSQWGAYSMAKNGKKAEDIINYFFKGVDIVKMWD